MKVIIYGAKGWIGQHVCRLLDKRGIVWSIGEARCDDISAIRTELMSEDVRWSNYTHVICLIGRTHGPGFSTIDYLEQPGKLVDNVRDNLFSPVMLALLCMEYGLHLTYMGTGCIFEGMPGDAGFSEMDKPNFFGSSYSIVKGFTDQIMGYLGGKAGPGILNVRIRMPITDEFGADRNFITKITRYAKICSMDNSMTVLDDLLPVMLDMLEAEKTGTINLVNPGIINHNRILELYREIVDPDFTWVNMTLDEQSQVLACGRSNNKLDTHSLESFIAEAGTCTDYGIEASVMRCLSRMKQTINPGPTNKIIKTNWSNSSFKTEWNCLATSRSTEARELVDCGGYVTTVVDNGTNVVELGLEFNVNSTINRHPTEQPLIGTGCTRSLIQGLGCLAGSCILVTGGCGFIGSNFINYMMNKYRDDPGFRIVNLDAMYYCAREDNISNWIRELDEGRYKFIKANLRDSSGFLDYIFREEKPDYILHFAAQSHVDSSFDGAKCLDYTLDNVLGTHCLMEACRVYGKCKKIIHVSTDEVYGESMLDAGLDSSKREETSILAPTNPYAATKAGAEMIAGSYKHSFGLPVIISRGNNVFGPGQYPEKLIPRWMALLRDGSKLEVAGTGAQLRSFLWVDDVARAFDIILERGVIGEIYNIGSRHEYSVLDVAWIMLEIFYRQPITNPLEDYIKFIPDRPFNDRRYFINSDKLEALGWKPVVDFRSGLEQLIL